MRIKCEDITYGDKLFLKRKREFYIFKERIFNTLVINIWKKSLKNEDVKDEFQKQSTVIDRYVTMGLPSKSK